MIKLKIKNLNYFLEIGFNNHFEILYKLESEIKNNKDNTPIKCVLIPYKLEGDCIFDFVNFYIDDFKNTIIVYEYSTTIS